MTIDNWLAFLFLALIATSSPGPAVLLILTNATIHGWRRCVYTAVGNIAALLIMATITVSGLGIVLITSELVFAIIKYLGAGYLIYLGIGFFLNNQTFIPENDRCETYPNKSSLSLFY